MRRKKIETDRKWGNEKEGGRWNTSEELFHVRKPWLKKNNQPVEHSATLNRRQAFIGTKLRAGEKQ